MEQRGSRERGEKGGKFSLGFGGPMDYLPFCYRFCGTRWMTRAAHVRRVEVEAMETGDYRMGVLVTCVT